MKRITNIKKTITFLSFILLLTINSYSQGGANVYITNVKYLGVNIANCGTVNLGSTSTHNISYNIKITRPYGSPSNPNSLDQSGTLKIKYYTYYGEFTNSSTNITANSNWTIDTSTNMWFIQGSGIATLYSSNISESGGILYGEYDTPSDGNIPYVSCDYDFTIPKFTLSPNNASVQCGTGQTFTVTNVNSSPGSLSYQWQVGDSWLYNGNAVSNIITNTNTITLLPNGFPPNNVKVIPVLDGVSFPQLTSSITLLDFNPSYSINGNTSICEPSTSSVYSIANLPSGLTVTWSSSNTAVATVSSTTGSNTTVNKVSNGTFNLIARVTNSCGQFVDIPKSIRIGGLPNFTINAVDTGGSYDLYIQAEGQGITSVTWTKISGNGQAGGNGLIGYADGSPTSNWTVTVRITATNDCGSTSITETYDGGGYGDPCRKVTIIKDKNKKNYFIAKAPVCRIGNSIIEENQEILNIKVYNIFGNFINEFKTENFDLSNAKKGIYIVNITTTINVISSKVLVD